jgi:transposase
MEHYAGIDVSLESASICVVEASGRVVREAKVASEPEALIAWFRKLGLEVTRIGVEAGPLSQWLYTGMREVGLAVELLETRHVRDAFKAMPVKTDRNDARGIAQLMRLGWFRSVHCKSLPAQERECPEIGGMPIGSATSRVGDRLEELGCGGCCSWLRQAMMPARGALT